MSNNVAVGKSFMMIIVQNVLGRKQRWLNTKPQGLEKQKVLPSCIRTSETRPRNFQQTFSIATLILYMIWKS